MRVWISAHTSENEWIAATDAGAVRFFPGWKTIDLAGLNTPEVFWKGEEWIRERHVSMIAYMPAWLMQLTANIRVVRRFVTTHYTVTSSKGMATQVVAVCSDPEGEQDVRVYFMGFRDVAVYYSCGRERSQSGSELG